MQELCISLKCTYSTKNNHKPGFKRYDNERIYFFFCYRCIKNFLLSRIFCRPETSNVTFIALIYKFILDTFPDWRIRYFWIDQRLTHCPLRRCYNHDILWSVVAVFVATHVYLRTQLQKHTSSIRMNKTNGEAVVEGSPIRYNIPL